jgi:hypothetical protein
MTTEERLDRLDEAVQALSAAGEKRVIGDLMLGELLKLLGEMVKGLNARVTAIEHGVLANDLEVGKN